MKRLFLINLIASLVFSCAEKKETKIVHDHKGEEIFDLPDWDKKGVIQIKCETNNNNCDKTSSYDDDLSDNYPVDTNYKTYHRRINGCDMYYTLYNNNRIKRKVKCWSRTCQSKGTFSKYFSKRYIKIKYYQNTCQGPNAEFIYLK